METLIVTEIFDSIQGESSYAGFPCSFVRLTGCNLRCKYCDTKYAYNNGISMSVKQVAERIEKYGHRLIEITGGEPLLQIESVNLLAETLFAKEDYIILLETNGSLDISKTNPRIIRIMDIKCPDSGMADKMDFNNFNRLRVGDEIKFVLSSYEDYLWALNLLRNDFQDRKFKTFFSPVYGQISPNILAKWMIDDNVSARLQLQLHKILWPNANRGV